MLLVCFPPFYFFIFSFFFFFDANTTEKEKSAPTHLSHDLCLPAYRTRERE